MGEHPTVIENTEEVRNNVIEAIPVSPQETGMQRTQAESEQANAEAVHTVAVGLALKKVHEARNAADLESVIEGMDFSDDKFKFAIRNSYHAEAKTFESNTVLKGTAKLGEPRYPDPDSHRINPDNLWGRPADKAHYSHEPVEQAGIRPTIDHQYEKREKLVPRRGLAGKLGFKQKTTEDVIVGEETKYVFDYAFAAPSHGEDAAKRVGHYTGQQINLSVELTKEQATQLSSILRGNPKAARQVLDCFMRSAGDYGKWNAELYDEQGNFHDPAERYGTGLEARDVRPNYDADPGLEPKIIGLIDSDNEAAQSQMYLPAA